MIHSKCSQTWIEGVLSGSGGFCQDPGSAVKLFVLSNLDPGGSVRIREVLSRVLSNGSGGFCQRIGRVLSELSVLSEHGLGPDPGSFVLSEVLSNGLGGFCQDRLTFTPALIPEAEEGWGEET